MGISGAGGIFIALFLESIMYGIASTMGITTMVVLSRMNSEEKISRRQLISVLCLMLMVATSHIIISFIRGYHAFILSPENNSDNTVENPLQNAKNILFIVQTILGDGVNIWRFYVIYGKKLKYIIIPSFLMPVGVVCGCLMVNSYAHLTSVESLFESTHWAEAYESIMILTNTYCTVAVSQRIYRNTKPHLSGCNARSALVIIAETGLLYTSSLAFCLCLYIIQSNSMTIAVDLILPLVPCIFCFMILQAQLNRSSSRPATYSIQKLPLPPDDAFSWVRMRGMVGRDHVVSISTARPVEVQVSREEDEHSPGEDVLRVWKSSQDFASIGGTEEA